MKKILNNNQSNAGVLSLIILLAPFLIVLAVVVLIIFIIFTGAIVLTIGWGALLGVAILLLTAILFYTKRLSPKQAAILGLIAMILIFASFLIPGFQTVELYLGGLT